MMECLRQVIKEELGDRVNKLENDVRDHENRIAMLERRGQPAGSASTAWASARTAPSGASSNPSTAGDGEYVIKFLVLRGWST